MKRLGIGIILLLLLIPYPVWPQDDDMSYDEFYFDLIAHDAAGNLVWNTSYFAVREGHQYGEVYIGIVSLAVDSAGVAYLLGYTGNGILGTKDLILLCGDFGSTLTELPVETVVVPAAMAVGAADVFVAGRDAMGRIAVEKIGAWSATYEPPDTAGYVEAMTLDGDGNIYVVGGREPAGSPDYDFVIIKVDSFGSVVWSATYGLTGEVDVAVDVAIDSAGNAAVVGTSAQDMAVVKYDPDGNELWNVRYNYGGEFPEHHAIDIAVDGEDEIVVAGIAQNAMYEGQVVAVKYNADGALLWSQADPTSNIDFEQAAQLLAVDGANNVFVAGQDADGNAAATKYSAAGAMQWMRQDPTFANPIAVDAAGDLFSFDVQEIDYHDVTYVVMKHGPLGVQWWEREVSFDLDCHRGEPEALALDGEGNVLVAGTHVREEVDDDTSDDDTFDDDTWSDDDTGDDADDADCGLFCSQIMLCSLADDFDLYDCANQCHGYSYEDVDCVIEATDCKEARACLAEPELDLGCGEGDFGCGC